MKMLVAARSHNGYWTPGRFWTAEPQVVEADAQLQKDLEEARNQFVLYTFPEAAKTAAPPPATPAPKGK